MKRLVQLSAQQRNRSPTPPCSLLWLNLLMPSAVIVVCIASIFRYFILISECCCMQVSTVLQPVVTNDPPPTYFRTDKFTSCFQVSRLQASQAQPIVYIVWCRGIDANGNTSQPAERRSCCMLFGICVECVWCWLRLRLRVVGCKPHCNSS